MGDGKRDVSSQRVIYKELEGKWFPVSWDLPDSAKVNTCQYE